MNTTTTYICKSTDATFLSCERGKRGRVCGKKGLGRDLAHAGNLAKPPDEGGCHRQRERIKKEGEG